MQDPFQQKALKEIENLSEKIINLGYSVSKPAKKLYNYEIIVINNKEQAKLLVYFGKKGIKNVIQSNPESKIFKELNSVVFGQTLFESDKSSEVKFAEYIGTDESGKGDYFGPLVVAAVYIDKKTTLELETAGVKDSKLISDNNIKIIESKIKKIVGDNFEIVQINPEKYNKLYESFNNLNKVMGWAHSKTIENLLQRISCPNVISDKFGNEKLIKDELRKKNIDLNLYQTPKAERYTAVAAASILARAKVVDWFNLKSREVGFNIPKGGGTSVNIVAKRVFNQFDENYLMKMIKFHFKNSQSIFKK
jgi:ribonuclease HIII